MQNTAYDSTAIAESLAQTVMEVNIDLQKSDNHRLKANPENLNINDVENADDYELAEENGDIGYEEDENDPNRDAEIDSGIQKYNVESILSSEIDDNTLNSDVQTPLSIKNQEIPQLTSANNLQTTTPIKKSSRLDKIAAMKLEVEEEARKKLMAQMGLNLDSIKILWESYKNQTMSMSTKTALSNCELDYKEKNILVIVPNASTKGIVMQEHGLMDEIRSKFGLQDITLELNVDPSLFPDIEVEELNKKLNPREVHQLFAKKNPDFESLIKKLNLKADNGSYS